MIKKFTENKMALYALLFFCIFKINAATTDAAGNPLLGWITSSDTQSTTSATSTASQSTNASIGSTISSAASNFFSSIGNTILSNTTFKQNLIPFATFITTLPANLVLAFKNSNYNDSSLTIGNLGQSDATANYGIKFAFSEGGSGSPDQPLDFVLANGKFYYKPTTVSFIPASFPVTDSAGNVTQVYRTDPRQFPFNAVIPLLLRGIAGEKGLSTWNYFYRFLSPLPEDVFIFKLFVLMFTTARNEAASAGYPRLITMPFELMTLQKKLAMTPDIQANVAKFVKNPNQKLQIETIDPADLVYCKLNFVDMLKGLPQPLVEAVNKITIPVRKIERQMYLDAKGKGLLQGLQYYGMLLNQKTYDQGSDFIKTVVTPYIRSGQISQTELRKLTYGVLVHALQRLDSLYNDLFVAFANPSKIVSMATGAQTSITDFETDIAIVRIAQIDDTALKTFMDNSFSKLSSVLTDFLSALGSVANFGQLSVNVAMQKALSDQNGILISHKNQIYALIINTIVAATKVDSTQSSKDAFNNAYNLLKAEFDKFTNYKNQVLYSLSDAEEIVVNLSEYMDIKQYTFEQILYKKFDGDVDYYPDSSALATIDAIEELFSIVARASDDMSKAGLLFQADTTGQYMNNLNMQNSKVIGVTKYQNFVQTPTTIVNTLSQNIKTLEAADQSSSTVKAQLQTLKTQLDQAQKDSQAAQIEWLNYVRQYRFDRRDKSGLRQGLAFNPEGVKSLSGLSEKLNKQQIDSLSKTLISKYGLTNSNAAVVLSAYQDWLRLCLAQEALADPNTPQNLQQSIIANQASVTSMNSQLQVLNTTIASLQSQLSQSISDQARVQATQNISSLQAQAAALTVQIQSTNDAIKASQLLISSISTDSTNLIALIDAYNQKLLAPSKITESSVRAGLAAKSTAWSTLINKYLVTPSTAVSITDPVKIGAITNLQSLISNNAVGNYLTSQEASQSTDVTVAAGIVSGISNLWPDVASILSQSSLYGVKNTVDSDYAKVVSGDLKLDDIGKNFAKAQGNSLSTFAPLIGSVQKNFFGTIARIFVYFFSAVYKTPAGPKLEEFLEANNNFEETNSAKIYLKDLLANIKPTSPLVDLSLTSPAWASAKASEMTLALDALMTVDTFFANSGWLPAEFYKPYSLPVDQNQRISALESIFSEILTESDDDLFDVSQTKKFSHQNTSERLRGLIKLAYELVNQFIENPAIIGSFVQSALLTIGNSKSGQTIGQIGQNTELAQIKLVFQWLSQNAYYILFYLKYATQAGVESSVQDFLVRELAMLSLRNQQVALLLASFNPIFIKVFGVDSSTLATMSQDQMADVAKQTLTNYGTAVTEVSTSQYLLAQDQANSLAQSSIDSTAIDATAVRADQLAALQGQLQTYLQGSVASTLIQKLQSAQATQSVSTSATSSSANISVVDFTAAVAATATGAAVGAAAGAVSDAAISIITPDNTTTQATTASTTT